jgi:hypothetical protein
VSNGSLSFPLRLTHPIINYFGIRNREFVTAETILSAALGRCSSSPISSANGECSFLLRQKLGLTKKTCGEVIGRHTHEICNKVLNAIFSNELHCVKTR